MTPGEKVRTDKLSEQVRRMVGEWRNEFTLRGGNDYMGYVYQQCASAFETLLPQIEELEQDAVSVITEAQMTHVKTWPDLGDCEWNCRTMEPLVALLEKVREREDALIKDALYIGQCVPQRIALNYDVLIKKVRARLVRKEQSK